MKPPATDPNGDLSDLLLTVEVDVSDYATEAVTCRVLRWAGPWDVTCDVEWASHGCGLVEGHDGDHVCGPGPAEPGETHLPDRRSTYLFPSDYEMDRLSEVADRVVDFTLTPCCGHP